MLPYAFYLLKVTICSGILFGYYWFILRNKIFHHYNRFYLLGSIVLSLVLPIVQINIWHSAASPAPNAIKILQVVNSEEYLDEIVITARQNNFTAEQVLLLFYIITSIIFLSFFMHALIRIRILFIKHRHSIVENIYFVNTTAKGTPFSFLKYIFWNDHIDPETPTGSQIFKHELAHVQQKHSHDKLFINAVLIFCWCNPFFWMMRKELNMIHEFIADKIAVEDSDTEAFAAMILQATYPQHRFNLSNPFFYSPIKRRLLMLTKNRNPKTGYIGRVLVLPLTVLVFAAFTLKAKTFKEGNARAYDGKKITVVIDAGHGGQDNGVVSLNGNIAEKDINLAIIKKIKSLNSNPNINIVATRETDVYQTPKEKAAFTLQQGADLFISVHIDGTTKEKAALFSGMSVWVAKDNYANAGNSKLFASAIINEFSTDYKLPVAANPQQRKMGTLVLQESPCPSVLIEAGYITNNTDLAWLQTDKAKEVIAGKILAAVEKYAFAKEGQSAIVLRSIISNEDFPGEKTDTVPETTFKNIEAALIIIDGKNSDQKELKTIRPENIISVNVLKGKEATAQYGEKGKNGVIIVSTKEKVFVLNEVKVNVEGDTIQKMVVSGKVTVKNDRNPTSKPLFIIDGKVQENGMDINTIPPNDIESITVLKGQSASAKYGEKAIEGAVEITTKSKKPIKEIPISGTSNHNTIDGITTVKYNSGHESAPAVYSSKTNPTELHLLRADLNIKPQEQPGVVFTKVEYEPEFPGGDSAWKNYLINNLKADMPIVEGWKPGLYKILLTFIVEKDGSIADVKSDNYAGTKTAEHCIDMIKKGPKWKPAVQNGHVVTCYKKQPITFVVPEK